MEWDPFHKKWNVREKVGENDRIIWPVSKGIEYTWRLGHETLRERLNDLRVRKTRDGDFVIELKFRLGQEGVLPKTIWDEKEVNATAYGTTLLRHLLGESQAFSFPKSVYAVGKAIRTCGAHDEDFTLDYFAGSGTTGHAVINLNREDGGRRKFILVEMADYFDTVLLPRIKKVTFTPEWKDGKPKRMATPKEAERSPRIVKVIRLESYEDALNNLSFDQESGPKALKLFRDDYLLSYMLKWETRHSETLLNVERLQAPFSYKLHLHRDGETRERTVDLPETFAYLLGLDVQTRRVYGDGGRRYLVYRGALRNGRTVVVIWRETKDWTEEDYRRDRDFVKEQKLTEGADEIYTNGDSFIPDARSLDGLFKARMFAPVEA
jgi:adenine-specific DNA-methyltransferase